ncbi:MAG TPA: phosphatase PAP2 family protein [Gemmatimonadaceae bacterium]|nr:phosphatase PAP2 family protein [Gemmatimonadaceae bacterium]
MKIGKSLALVALLGATNLAAQDPAPTGPGDTVGVGVSRDPLFTKRDAWIAGGFVVGTIVLFPLDKYAARELQRPQTQANRFFRHQATNVRLITENAYWIGGGLYLVGRLSGNDQMADLGWHGTEAIAVGMGITTLGKVLAGRARPLVNIEDPTNFKFGRGLKQENYRSFPSGHTLTAFAAASAVTAETARWWPKQKWLIGTAMYGGATLVGLSRMYNNKHWASDVMMGAAIGTFAGRKVVRYHHSHPNNRIDRIILGANISPSVDGGMRLSLSLAPGR